nr:phosphopantetheine-binding protein [Streptomyces typhae]
METGRAPVNERSRLYEDLGLDSLMLMQLMHLLQERRPQLGDLLLPDIVSHMADVGTLTDLLRAATGEDDLDDTGAAGGPWCAAGGIGQKAAA